MIIMILDLRSLVNHEDELVRDAPYPVGCGMRPTRYTPTEYSIYIVFSALLFRHIRLSKSSCPA